MFDFNMSCHDSITKTKIDVFYDSFFMIPYFSNIKKTKFEIRNKSTLTNNKYSVQLKDIYYPFSIF